MGDVKVSAQMLVLSPWIVSCGVAARGNSCTVTGTRDRISRGATNLKSANEMYSQGSVELLLKHKRMLEIHRRMHSGGLKSSTPREGGIIDFS
jgi:hypothetical protein